jgi:hypothetical protein
LVGLIFSPDIIEWNNALFIVDCDQVFHPVTNDVASNASTEC